MTLAQSFVAELNHEAAVARKLLERVPNDKLGWKPHDKSMTFGRLASHIAEIPGWVAFTLDMDHLNLDSGQFTAFNATNNAELIKTFDENTKQARNKLNGTNDGHLMKNWKMTMGGRVIIDMPRAAVVRTWVINHLIHHRGQLSVYLRLNNIPVPAIYGPSADEQG